MPLGVEAIKHIGYVELDRSAFERVFVLNVNQIVGRSVPLPSFTTDRVEDQDVGNPPLVG